jgi:hypothetical protein
MHFTATYNPKGNSYGERQHGPMASLFNMFLHGRSKDEWDDPFLIETMNYVGGTYPSQSRGGLTPSFIETGVDVMDPFDWELSRDGPVLPPSNLAKRLAMLHCMRRTVAQVHQQARDSSAARRDGKSGPNKFKVGDIVWIHIDGTAADGGGKIGDKLMGPYEVLEWRQAEERTAWLRNVRDETDVISSCVDFWKLEKEVPEHMRLNYQPLMFTNSAGNDWFSSAGSYLEEVQDQRRLVGEFGEGPSYEPREVEQVLDEDAGDGLSHEERDEPAELVARDVSTRVAEREEAPGVYEVDKIKDHANVHSQDGSADRDYLVCWKGFLDEGEDRWVPREELLATAAEAVAKYEARLTHAQRWTTLLGKRLKKKG